MIEDWIKTPLHNACEILDNLRKPINSSDRGKRIGGKNGKELFPYYGATGQVGLIDDYLTDGEFVLIGEDGAPFLDYSKNVAYKISGKSWVNNHAHILNSYFNNDFLLHFLNQFQYKDYVTGTTRLKLTQGALKRIPVLIAPLPIQRAIVAKIETLFSDLDNGIADLKKAQEQLKIYRQAVLKKAFENFDLVKLDSFIDSTQNGLSKRVGKEGREYKVLRLSDINDLQIDDLNSRSIQMIETELLKYQLFEDDLLIIRVNGSIDLVGRFIHVTKENERQVWAYCDHFIKLRLDKNKCFSKFYFYYVQLAKVRKYIHENMVSSAGQNTVSQTTIKAIEVPNAEITEQRKTVRKIESLLSVCEKVEESIYAALNKSKALRQSILKKAFEGKLLSPAEIAKCKQEADYEPASKLLERIKQEQNND